MNSKKDMFCNICDQIYNVDELVMWRHDDIDGGRPYMVCPHCAQKASRYNLENDLRTARVLLNSLSEIPCYGDDGKDCESCVYCRTDGWTEDGSPIYACVRPGNVHLIDKKETENDNDRKEE